MIYRGFKVFPFYSFFGVCILQLSFGICGEKGKRRVKRIEKIFRRKTLSCASERSWRRAKLKIQSWIYTFFIKLLLWIGKVLTKVYF